MRVEVLVVVFELDLLGVSEFPDDDLDDFDNLTDLLVLFTLAFDGDNDRVNRLILSLTDSVVLIRIGSALRLRFNLDFDFVALTSELLLLRIFWSESTLLLRLFSTPTSILRDLRMLGSALRLREAVGDDVKIVFGIDDRELRCEPEAIIVVRMDFGVNDLPLR